MMHLNNGLMKLNDHHQNDQIKKVSEKAVQELGKLKLNLPAQPVQLINSTSP